MQGLWPPARPAQHHAGSDRRQAALLTLLEAHRCIRALHGLLEDSEPEASATPGALLTHGVPVGPCGWPAALPCCLQTCEDFASLAVACRALRAWCEEADLELQRLADADDDDALVQQMMENAGWQLARAADNALHLAALSVAAAAGLWARFAAVNLVRDMRANLDDAVAALV